MRRKAAVVERKALAVERELVVAKSASQSGNELAAEDTAEDLDGQQEGRARRYPVCLIRRQTAAGHDAVDVGGGLQGLSPGVQDGEQADPSAEMPGIGCDFQQRGRAGFEQ